MESSNAPWVRLDHATPKQLAALAAAADGAEGEVLVGAVLVFARPGVGARPAASPQGCGTQELLSSLARIERKVDAVRKAQSANGVVERDDDLSDDELRKIYARVLLTSAKRSGGREAPLKEVFDRYCLDGLSARKVSEVLGCSKSTVMIRLATLKRIAGVPATRLRTYKPFFERVEESLRDPRARRGLRKQAAYGDETRGAE
jgi:hypothetical protein